MSGGLNKDFRIANIFVPPAQIVDTVTIWCRPPRMIALRFLANFLLGKAMQQDTHDSIEDARVSYVIYRRALKHRRAGTFEQTLASLYDFGPSTSSNAEFDSARKRRSSGLLPLSFRPNPVGAAKISVYEYKK